MKVPSQDVAKFSRLIKAALLWAPLVLAAAPHSRAAPASTQVTEIKATQAVSEVAKLSILDILVFQLVRFLNANGDVTPAPNAYFPEHGDPGYFDSYYGAVDPQGKRTTLADWKAENDFDDYPSLIKKAEYINAADLGFGRKMHCIDNSRTSCYVENYLDPKGASNFAATVAMERMPNDYGSFVAFFVFDAAGNRINQIALDNEGPKSVPQSCWACHGGYGHGSAFFGGNYLPFDVNLLQDWPGHPTRATQADKFRALNYIVWSDAEYRAENDHLTDLIEKWYGGIPYSGTTYSQAATPSTWVTNAAGGLSQNTETYKKHKVETFLYQEIYGKYCRMCHVAQDLDWQDAHAADFTLAAYNHLCGTAKSPTMPHAEVTYKDFNNEARHTMPSLSPPSLIANTAVINTGLQLTANAPSRATAELRDPQVVAVDDLVFALQHTGREMLCDKLPLSVPAGNKTNGGSLFSSKGCANCHYIATYENKPGGDLECRGAWLRQKMGSVNSAMNAINLNLQEIQDIGLYLNDRPACN